MKPINKMFNILPVFLIVYYAFCLSYFMYTDFYNEHYYTLDNLDSLIVGMLFIHYFFFYKEYNAFSKNCLISITSLLALTFIYPYIYEKLYYILFCIAIIVPLANVLFMKKN